jgi:hypothetical protein
MNTQQCHVYGDPIGYNDTEFADRSFRLSSRRRRVGRSHGTFLGFQLDEDSF